MKTKALKILLLATTSLTVVGCGLATNAVMGTAGAAMRTVGGVTQTALSVLPGALDLAPAKLMFLCIPEGTPVDTPEGSRPIEAIRPGDTVIGFGGETVRVLQKHSYAEDPAVNRFLRVEFGNGAVVRLCDMHRIGGVRAKDLEPGDRIDGQTVAAVSVFGGVERSHDLLTEDDGYRISGLPVNSMIEEMIAAARSGVSRE